MDTHLKMHIEGVTGIIGLESDKIDGVYYKSLFRFPTEEGSRLDYATYNFKCVTLSNGIELSNVVNVQMILPVLVKCDIEFIIESDDTIHINEMICNTNRFISSNDASSITF